MARVSKTDREAAVAYLKRKYAEEISGIMDSAQVKAFSGKVERDLEKKYKFTEQLNRVQDLEDTAKELRRYIARDVGATRHDNYSLESAWRELCRREIKERRKSTKFGQRLADLETRAEDLNIKILMLTTDQELVDAIRQLEP